MGGPSAGQQWRYPTPTLRKANLRPCVAHPLTASRRVGTGFSARTARDCGPPLLCDHRPRNRAASAERGRAVGTPGWRPPRALRPHPFGGSPATPTGRCGQTDRKSRWRPTNRGRTPSSFPPPPGNSLIGYSGGAVYKDPGTRGRASRAPAKRDTHPPPYEGTPGSHQWIIAAARGTPERRNSLNRAADWRSSVWTVESPPFGGPKGTTVPSDGGVDVAL